MNIFLFRLGAPAFLFAFFLPQSLCSQVVTKVDPTSGELIQRVCNRSTHGSTEKACDSRGNWITSISRSIVYDNANANVPRAKYEPMEASMTLRYIQYYDKPPEERDKIPPPHNNRLLR